MSTKCMTQTLKKLIKAGTSCLVTGSMRGAGKSGAVLGVPAVSSEHKWPHVTGP